MSAGTFPRGLSMEWDFLQIQWFDSKVEKEERDKAEAIDDLAIVTLEVTHHDLCYILLTKAVKKICLGSKG